MASVMGAVITGLISELRGGGGSRDRIILSLYAVKGDIVLFGEGEYVVVK